MADDFKDMPVRLTDEAEMEITSDRLNRPLEVIRARARSITDASSARLGPQADRR
jgi:hypothetical protein